MAYNANTNFANERKYLNNLISGGGGNAEWAKNQMKELNSAEQKYGNSGGSSGGGSSGSRSGGSSGGSSGVYARGYAPDGGIYEIGSERGRGFLDSAAAGSVLNGSDGSVWTKNEDGTTTITKNGVQYTVGTPQVKQVQQPQQVNDLSDYLRDIYRQQMQANLSALEGAYNANVTRLRRQGELAPQKYDAMRNLAAAQNELSRRNFGEYAAARGLNTGTSGQAELARSVELQRNLADLGAQEAEASGNLESELTALEQQYNAAVAQAQASGNADLANALYQELVRRQSAAAAQAEADAEQQRWRTEFEASRKDAADNLALAYAKLEASNRKSAGKGKTQDDIGGVDENTAYTGPSGGNGYNSSYFNAALRSMSALLAQGNESSALSGLDSMWSKLNDTQKKTTQNLLGRYGLTYRE